MAVAVDGVRYLFNEIARTFQIYNEVLTIAGAYFVLQKAVKALLQVEEVIRIHFWPRLPGRKRDLAGEFGKWAVVTGSTDGIGKAYARELASHGLNIVLISRSEDKLKRVAKDIETNFTVKTKTIKADFCQGSEIYDDIERQMQGLQIGILVNNVGAMDIPQYFLNMKSERLWQLININIGAATLMTKILMPQMVERRRGAVVNISAAASIHPNPQLAVYHACKTYMDYFTRALQYEYKAKGIFIQSLMPSYVATKMTDFKDGPHQSNLMIPSAYLYARHAVSTLGRSTHTTGYWPHTLLMWFSRQLPERMWMWSVSVINSALRRQAVNKKRRRASKGLALS
ncbi:inactive hydroxysteroid dehydrogenase-like protein 1 [Acanthaster planci]|uniref:Inactive hydroxysteroid dehydrogenase-like protein 1 n=1 Tax=Acanthaster planci TaxID=133434 RepID=A0A8B7YP40_ACAPL|nr:inactive hydroxysteroid dehydrogenase-like protein 1 [Acanthaster planci]